MKSHRSVPFEGIPLDTMELSEDEDSGLLRPQSGAMPPTKAEKRRGCFWASLCTSLGHVLLGTRLNVLLIFVPVAVVADVLRLGKAWAFSFTLLAIVPLAERLGFLTEQLAMHTNSTVGGLMNATFGNATEVIVAVFALRGGLLRVVQLSLLGSILSNMLLVLGTSFFLGGCLIKVQRFNQTAALVNSGLLLMAVMGMLLPAVLYATHTELRDGTSELFLSRFTSLLMLIAYGAYLYFQLKSHSDLYLDASECGGQAAQIELSEGRLFNGHENGHVAFPQPSVEESPSSGHVTALGSPEGHERTDPYRDNPPKPADNPAVDPNPNPGCALCCPHGKPLPALSNVISLAAATDDVSKEEEEGEESVLGFWNSVAWLAAVTVLIAILSDRLVATLQGAAQAWNVSVAFISVIVLPIVGNAAEHASAVMFAWQNRLDITLGVAIGSSTQIAMFVTPFCVVLGWILGKPLDLNFHVFETATLFITVLVVVFLLQDGTSNWLKGLLLVFCYLIIGASFFVHQDEIAPIRSTGPGGGPPPHT
ncbi:sodium/calcium exchanger protein [Klebsormidium nitens]|uniref:Sodium/calcium exchanger protein n=1 Tax=Klebsormidium nitens TaxID=105231 RepID=A0A1Y1HW09_KLENI|nr:sodium/calcium exchanger protein [Klebsormidium nitens]|eukprot:GAQ81171.1 sodium/calcium exchanger protein [Klebsormidium nitens]